MSSVNLLMSVMGLMVKNSPGVIENIEGE